MKFNIYKSIAVCSLVALAGCHDFEEMNTNPYQPGYIPEATENVSPNGYDIDYQLSEKALASLKERESGIGSTLYGFFYDGAWDNYQTTTNLTHDIYAGYTGNNVNGFVFASGQIPIDPATGNFVEGGIKEQTRQSLTNAQNILKAAGTDLSHVVKTTVYLNSMDDFAAMNEVYAEFFSQPYPARSAVAVEKLPKGALVEVEVLAAK